MLTSLKTKKLQMMQGYLNNGDCYRNLRNGNDRCRLHIRYLRTKNA